jgi:DNA-binding response OmpR family regulator
MSTPKHTILYAEDDLDDLFIVKEAFERLNATIELIHTINGFDTILRLESMNTSGVLPCLIILDINMPGMDGKEALMRIKQSDTFKTIPTVLFTTSSSEMDKSFARKWGADFITKPLMYNELEELARTFIRLCGHEMKRA